MSEFHDEGIFPLAGDELWKFLDSHTDPAVIGRIHSNILAQRVLSHEGNVTMVERTIKFGRKNVRSVWKITSTPPVSVRWDIVEGDGPMAVGSWLENHYSTAPGGTRIESSGDIRIVGFPRFLMKFLVGRVLAGIDRQDHAFLGRKPG
ncbi:MAG: hypothetical protein L3J86_01510 [Thermoplasmata archaeon]|jgi:hypothetical protein|nr:hypothetical protein [Thermoplasmata archaeon]